MKYQEGNIFTSLQVDCLQDKAKTIEIGVLTLGTGFQCVFTYTMLALTNQIKSSISRLQG